RSLENMTGSRGRRAGKGGAIFYSFLRYYCSDVDACCWSATTNPYVTFSSRVCTSVHVSDNPGPRSPPRHRELRNPQHRPACRHFRDLIPLAAVNVLPI